MKSSQPLAFLFLFLMLLLLTRARTTTTTTTTTSTARRAAFHSSSLLSPKHTQQCHHQYHLLSGQQQRGGGRVRRRRRGLLQQAIEAGEWVLLKDSGSKARVLSANKGWWRVKEEGSERVFSVRANALVEMDQPEDPSKKKKTSSSSSSTTATTIPIPSRFSGPRPLFLDATTRHPLHAQTKDWIVFSDLHCSIQTLPTCREVLAKVHAEAQARQAGIIFLGDFFHIRGAIRVELLNSIMADLGQWTQPVVMIPGNHDQVTLDGTVHALTPLGFAVGSNAAPSAASIYAQGGGVIGGLMPGQAVVVSHPTVFLDALWLPYSRDPAVTRALLAPYQPQEDRDDDYHQELVKAVFCHVDVRGAPMNDNTASRRGLRPSTFPSHLPVYSGHFHKPHKVDKSSVTYIGSPYQVSLAEAGQTKRFLILRRPDTDPSTHPSTDTDTHTQSSWTEVGDITVDIGRRYFRPRTITAAKELLTQAQLRKGDRVVLNLPDASSTEKSKEIEQLRAHLRASAQAELEVREAAPEEDGVVLGGALDGLLGTAAGGGGGGKEGGGMGVMDYETLGTTAVWRAYMEEAMGGKKENRDSEGKSHDDLILEEGLKLIETWEASTGNSTTTYSSSTSTSSSSTLFSTTTNHPTTGGPSANPVRLELERVKIAGYGPFLKSVEYPLGGRGLVLLRGKNMDDPGAESNAAGKSKLAMAGLWALTGEGDEKPVMDGKVTDIAYDVSSRGKASFAEVTLWGSVNGVEFEVCRKRGTRMNQIRFVLGGEDLTRQTAKDTQKAMEEALGLDLDFLELAIFCGQHQMNGLLEATDVKLKERLSKIVRLGVWEDLKEMSKVRVKGYVEEGMGVETQVRVQELDLERQELEEAELLEALSREEAGGGVSLLGGTGVARTLDQVEMELGSVAKQLEEAQAAWTTAIERREEWARGQAEAGQSAGARQEKLRTLKVAVEEDVRALTLLEDRWDPSLYWAELQRWGVVPKEAVVDSTLGLAFAAHVSPEEWNVKVAAVETARTKCLSEIGAAAGDLRKVEGALESLLKGDEKGEGGEDLYDHEGCPTCGRAWDEGGGDAKARAIEHLRGEIAKCQKLLNEAEEKRPRLDKQKTVLTRIADAHVQYLRDVHDWQVLRQRLQARKEELGEVEKETAAAGDKELLVDPAAAKEDNTLETAKQQQEDELTAREKAFRALQQQYDHLQEERPRLIHQAAEIQAKQRAAADLRTRLEKKRTELTKARETLENTRLRRSDLDEQARLSRELVDKFGMRGVQAFVLRGAVAQLERLANRFLSLLSESGLRLGLSLDGEKISKEVKVRGGDGVFHDRSLAQLSGGQWRRASLAALMAFRELSRLRSRVDCNVMVLDEVLNHLDGAGRARVGKLLRAMVQEGGGGGEEEGEEEEEGGRRRGRKEKRHTGIDTAIVILQDLAAFELEEAFDFVDEVVKEGDVSRVVLDARHAMLLQERAEAEMLLGSEGEGEEEDSDDDEDDEDDFDGGAGGGKGYILQDDAGGGKGEVWGVNLELPSPPSSTTEGEREKKKDEEERERTAIVAKKNRATTAAAAKEKDAATSLVQGGWLDGLEEAQLI